MEITPGLAFSLFLLATPALSQELVQTLTEGEVGSQFGYEVVLGSPDRLLVSAPDHDVGPFQNAGRLFIYQRQGAAWTLDGILESSTPGTDGRMGRATDLQGDLAAALQSEHFTGSQPGVHLFERDVLGWSEVQTIWPTHGLLGSDPFTVLSIAGESVLIGFYKDESFEGRVYCYDRTPGGWVEAPAPVPEGGPIGSGKFGAALDWDDATGRLAVGAAGEGGGAVYIYERPGGTWVQVARITTFVQHGWFGWAVDLDGDELVVGAPNRNFGLGEAGAVYMYSREASGDWVQAGPKLLASDRAAGDHFGRYVELDGDRLLVTATNENSPGCGGEGDVCHSGAIYAFHRRGGSWEQTSKTLNPSIVGVPGSVWFGTSIALEADTMVAGLRSSSSGGAAIFDLPAAVTPYGFCDQDAPCDNADSFAGCANSTGGGGHLRSTGSTSVADDELSLHAEGLVADQFGIFFLGGASASLPLGDGNLLVSAGGSGLFRFPPQSTGPEGAMILGPGLVGLSASLPPGGQIPVGSTLFFQAYYRDPSGPCAQGSNLTNGLRVTFGR